MLVMRMSWNIFCMLLSMVFCFLMVEMMLGFGFLEVILKYICILLGIRKLKFCIERMVMMMSVMMMVGVVIWKLLMVVVIYVSELMVVMVKMVCYCGLCYVFRW